ncbi:MAG: hypothetical protein P4L79_10850 [Legionella sp.]|uniref:hypothetical protein n=1 Tax=Legionella sp. TaxID=459 RepID=UPI00284A6F50|nr:hypothetical protein [Legionella sp.]
MKNLKFLLLIPFLCFGLTGCNESQVRTEVARYRVVDVPVELYNGCPEVGAIPNYKKLTDQQVAQFIIKLYGNNVKCRQSITAIHNYLIEAHKTIDNKPVELHNF